MPVTKKPRAVAKGDKGKPAVHVHAAKQAERAEPLSPRRIEPMNSKGECQQKLDALGLQGLCELILQGNSTAAIGRQLGISAASMVNWIAADPERSTRVREARKESAESDIDRAESVLLEATTAVEVARARELASHYRWRAKTSNPARFGDKLEIDNTIKVNELSDADLDKQIHRLAQALGPGALAALTGASASTSTDGAVA